MTSSPRFPLRFLFTHKPLHHNRNKRDFLYPNHQRDYYAFLSAFRRMPRLWSIIPLVLLAFPAYPGDRAISLTQEAELPGRYSADLSLKSPFLDGTLTLRNETPLPAPEDYPDEPVNPVGDLSLRTWSLALKPTRACVVSAGSLALSGLPARAKNPFFTLTKPRYSPLLPSNDPIVRPGTTLDADDLALECETDRWSLAAAGDPRHRLDEPAWCLVGRRFGSREAGAKRLALILFGGAHALTCPEETSWFLDEPFTPEANLYVPGAEIAFSGAVFTGSTTVFESVGPFRDPGYLLRADCSATGRYCALTAGYAQAFGDFLPLDGKREPYLKRAFIAPSVTLFPRRTARQATCHARLTTTRSCAPPEICFGGIVISDLLRREHYYEADTAAFTMGGFCALSGNRSDLELQCMAKETETALTGRFSLKRPKNIPLAFAAHAKTTIPKGAVGLLDGNDLEVSAGTVWTCALSGKKRPIKNESTSLETTLTGTLERPEPADRPELSGTLGFALSVLSRHSRIRVRVEGGVSQGNVPWNGTLGLETEFR
jgi:hypothetical protein